MREFLTRFPLEFSISSKDNTCFDKYLANNTIKSTFGGYKRPFYNCLFNNGYQLEGWKIHVSPYLKDYGKVLTTVSQIMLENKTSFKFAYYLSDYLLLSDKNINPSQFGKYITIYPKNNTEFKLLLDILYKKSHNLSGVRVPSDKRYKNSKIISYRFGGFFPQIFMTNTGDMTYKILDGEGNFVSDDRKTYFKLPAGINDPFPSISKKDKVISPCLIGQETTKKFKIINIIRRLGTGNIYEGIECDTQQHVIVKEARLGALPDKSDSIYRAWNLKKNERVILENNKIQNLIDMPKYIDQLYIDDSFYIVEEKINGLSLRELLQQNSMLNKKQSKNTKLDLDNNLINIWRQILTFVTRLHSSGYILNDISDDNFIYNRQTKKIALVDVETIQTKKNNLYSKIATNNFCIRMPLNLDDYNKDCYKLSLLMFYTIFNKVNDFIFDKNFFINRFNLLKEKLTTNQKIILSSAFTLYSLSKSNRLDSNFDLCSTLDLKELTQYDNNKEFNIISSQKISDLKKTLLIQYTNHSSDLFDYLKCTPYVGDASNSSLIYGKLGAILALKNELKNMDMTATIHKAKSSIIELESKKQLNLGLFFGLAGTTLFEFYTNTPYEQNYSLIKLLERIKNEPQNNTLCNGYAGIVLTLQLISNKRGYPDFTKHITSMLMRLQSDIGKTTDEGLEYGDLGSALVFLMEYKRTKQMNYLSNVKLILKNYLETYKNENPFTGISYNSHKWKNIRSPYLMNGSAGLIFILFKYYCLTDNTNWDLLYKYLDSLNLPFTYNYGVNNGTAGILLVIKTMLKSQRKIPNQLYTKIKNLNDYYTNHLFYSFINSKKHSGWPSDGQAFISDDIGAGTFGILYVITSEMNKGVHHDYPFIL